MAYRQPSEETFLFIPVECRRLYLHPWIGVCQALPVHQEALITAADVFTGPLSHEEAVATAGDLLDILATPHSRMDTSSGRLSPRAVRDGPFGPECWKFISKVRQLHTETTYFRRSQSRNADRCTSCCFTDITGRGPCKLNETLWVLWSFAWRVYGVFGICVCLPRLASVSMHRHADTR